EGVFFLFFFFRERKPVGDANIGLRCGQILPGRRLWRCGRLRPSSSLPGSGRASPPPASFLSLLFLCSDPPDQAWPPREPLPPQQAPPRAPQLFSPLFWQERAS